MQIGAKRKNPFVYLRDKGFPITQEVFDTWWEKMSKAIFEKLLTGWYIGAGGRLGEFQLCRRIEKGRSIVYLEHHHKRSNYFHAWFTLSRHRDHRENYQIILRNQMAQDEFLEYKFQIFETRARRKGFRSSDVDRRIDSCIVRVCKEVSILTKIPSNTFLQMHRAWTRFVSEETMKEEKVALRWYCIMGSNNGGCGCQSAKTALKEWKKETGFRVSKGIHILIDRSYRHVVARYKQAVREEDREFIKECQSYNKVIEMVYARTASYAKGTRLTHSMVSYIVRSLAAKRVGGVVLPYRISKTSIQSQLNHIQK